MSSRRARFRFEMDQDVAVVNKRTLAKLASSHIYDSMTFSNRSLLRLEESLLWLGRLISHEDRLLAMDVMENDPQADADRELRDQAHAGLRSAMEAILAIRNRRVEIASQMEEDFDPIFKGDAVKRSPLPVKEVPSPPVLMQVPASSPPAPVPVPVPVPTPPPPTPVAVEALPPAPPKLKLDPRLIARARGEISRRAQQDE